MKYETRVLLTLNEDVRKIYFDLACILGKIKVLKNSLKSNITKFELAEKIENEILKNINECSKILDYQKG